MALGFLLVAFQNLHDGDYGVPIPCRGSDTEQFVDLPKIADRFHVATVHSEDKSLFPFPARRQCAWNGSQAAAGFRQDAHESNHIGAWRFGCKRIFHLHADKIATVAEHHFRLEWQLPEKCSTKLGSKSGFSNDEGACRADIHDTIIAQLFGEDARTKRPVSANIYSSEENNESHSGIIE